MSTTNYFPTESKMIENKLRFRYWHVESLLNQSANLIDQCLQDLNEAIQLEILDFTNKQEIEYRLIEIGDTKKRTDIFERQLKEAENDLEIYKRTNPFFIAARDAADSHSYLAETSASKPSHLQSIQNREQFAMTDAERNLKQWMTEKKIGWLKEDAENDKSFWEYKEDHAYQMRRELENEEGNMNYERQKIFCYTRLSRNYSDCLDRALVAEEGLFMIFGISLQPNIRSLMEGEPDLYLNRVNILYNWIYEQIEFLTAYSQLDQSFTICIPLRGIIPPSIFESMKNSDNNWSTTFEIPQHFFPTASHSAIRFKGVGAYLVGNVGKIPWSMKLKLPSAAVYIWPENRSQVDQSQLPSALLGRVENRNSTRSIEYAGAISLNNASPVGASEGGAGTEWHVSISRPNSVSESFQNIEDIVIELSLTGKLVL